ncbi:MNIO family bufferin maturase [Oceanibaculum nanhaiense]|uniref:MNIO family bufferin maturase n=1 Tax=Oceanibaculum nanhaiense TaxID=1909734 RepID=UPI003F6EC2A4
MTHGNPTIPDRAGAGFKLDHAADIADARPDIGWFEVHPENYMVEGGPRLTALARLRADYPLSLHGVGLSLGSVAPPDLGHLKEFRRLIDRFDPGLISDHLSWSAEGGTYFADLLPLPLTEEALDIVCRNIVIAQDVLRRPLLIENPSVYVGFEGAEMDEPEFLIQLARRTGCGLLLDVNNAYVSGRNMEYDPAAYLDAFPGDLIGEIHLAGHTIERHPEGELLIDTHSTAVPDPVWQLYEKLIARTGPRPTLIEWDNDVPAWPVLAAEVQKADGIIAALAREPAHA